MCSFPYKTPDARLSRNVLEFGSTSRCYRTRIPSLSLNEVIWTSFLRSEKTGDLKVIFPYEKETEGRQPALLLSTQPYGTVRSKPPVAGSPGFGGEMLTQVWLAHLRSAYLASSPHWEFTFFRSSALSDGPRATSVKRERWIMGELEMDH